MQRTYENLTEIIEDFEAGKLQREDYWAEMQRFHLNMANYCNRIKGHQFDHIEINAAGLQVVLKNGLRFQWQPEDIRTAPNMLVNHGEYEPIESAVVVKLMQFCQVVFDIGANIGWYTLHMAQKLKKGGGRVFAFEPVPASFAMLLMNIELNQSYDVAFPFELALGEAAVVTKLFIPNSSGSAAASRRQLFPQETNQSLECKMVTLDEFVKSHDINQIDLIKCDVEGSELYVLRGGIETIRTHLPIIMLEMLRKWAQAFDYHPNEIISMLKVCGYQCWFFNNGSMQQLIEMDEGCTQTNFFFLHHLKHKDVLASFSL